jgi:hypothetical protein
MALTPEETATLRTRLKEAEDALHSLQLGNKTRVYVDQNGERVEFNLNSVNSLRSYVAELKSELGIRRRGSGPMSFRGFRG